MEIELLLLFKKLVTYLMFLIWDCLIGFFLNFFYRFKGKNWSERLRISKPNSLFLLLGVSKIESKKMKRGGLKLS